MSLSRWEVGRFGKNLELTCSFFASLAVVIEIEMTKEISENTNNLIVFIGFAGCCNRN